MHEANVGLLLLFGQSIPFSGQAAFFGSRVTDQSVGPELGQELFLV